jgi:hypothetical protein
MPTILTSEMPTSTITATDSATVSTRPRCNPGTITSATTMPTAQALATVSTATTTAPAVEMAKIFFSARIAVAISRDPLTSRSRPTATAPPQSR